MKIAAVAFLLPVALAGCSLFSSTESKHTAPPPPPVQAPAATNDMRNVQQKLADAGFYHGSIDGMWGPASVNALRAYQKFHSLEVTGQMDDHTRAEMYPETH